MTPIVHLTFAFDGILPWVSRPLSSINSWPQALMSLIVLSFLSLPDTPSAILCYSHYSVNSVFTLSGLHLISILSKAKHLLGWSCQAPLWVLEPILLVSKMTKKKKKRKNKRKEKHLCMKWKVKCRFLARKVWKNRNTFSLKKKKITVLKWG